MSQASSLTISQSASIVHRITLAWAVSECALGGFFHVLKTPFTGVILGGLSVLFISLIAYHAERKAAAIVQALLFVLAVKMAASPHSPVGAYFAVSLQALLGLLFFSLIPRFSWAAMATGVMSLMSSALQKVLILTILFGVGFWEAIDRFAQSTIKKMDFMSSLGNFSASQWLVATYVGVYAIAGLVIGRLAGRLPQLLKTRAGEFDQVISRFNPQQGTSDFVKQERKKKPWKIWAMAFVFITLGIGLQWVFISRESAIDQFLRAMGILLLWLVLIRPLFKWILKKTVQEQSLNAEMADVQKLIPEMGRFARFAWRERGFSEGNPLLNFIHIYVYYAVYRS